MNTISSVTGSAMDAEWLVNGSTHGFKKGYLMARKSILGGRSNPPAPISDVDIDDLLEEMEEENEEILEPQKLSLPEPKLDPIVTSSPNYESKWKNELPNDFDIFRDLTGEWLEKNAKQPVYYVIYRDSRSNYVAERYPPYSWAKLQQEFGAGYYIVIAKERGTNRVVIQQPRLVEDFKSAEKTEIRKEPEVSVQDISRLMDEKLAAIRPKEPQFQNQNQQPSITELLTLVFSLQEKAVARQPQNNDSSLIGNIINLVQAQNEKSAQTTQEQSRMMIEMFSRMSENTNNVVKAINENQQKMFEKMNERIENVTKEIGKANKKESDMIYSPQQIIEMQQKAQQTGFEMWSRLESMAESKARQRIEIMESIKSEEIEEAKPKPFSERMFESMMPALATVLTQLGRQQAVGAPVPQVQLQQPVRALPTPNNVRPIQPNQQVRPIQPNQQVRQAAQPQAASPKKPVRPVKQPVEVESAESDDLPSVDFSNATKNKKSYLENPKFEQYIGILQPILLEAWAAKNSIEETGEKLVQSLKTQGVSLPDFLENVAYEDVEDALSEFQLAPEIFTWLKELYAYIETKLGLFPGNGTVG